MASAMTHKTGAAPLARSTSTSVLSSAWPAHAPSRGAGEAPPAGSGCGLVGDQQRIAGDAVGYGAGRHGDLVAHRVDVDAGEGGDAD